jgi:NtrC-family two-component system sensor histidine kinase KinB
MSDAALDSLYDPVIVTDAHGRIFQLNPAAEAVFGAVAPAPRVPVAEHIKDPRIVRAIESAVTQEAVSASEDERGIVSVPVAGADRKYRLRATPMKDEDGNLLGSVVVLEDITHIRELDRLKNEFIGVASHELRTPVTSLLLSVQLLEEGAVGPLTPSQLEIISVQKEDLQRLEKLMRDLLDITKLEAGSTPPRLEPVLPTDIITSAARPLISVARQKGVDLDFSSEADLPKVRVDRGQIGRVLTNLLNNAIRHTKAGGRVTARAFRTGNQVTFQVEDSGEGIPPEYLATIFERFVQVPGATGGGAGLGLSIAQTIVKAHGGEMTVRSELGKGSAFQFSLEPVSGAVGVTQV